MFDQEVIVKLLGKMVFTDEEIKSIVTFKKGDKSKSYILGYNSYDGTKSQVEIAKIIGVTSGTLSPIMKQWENAGIVFRTQPSGNYKNIRQVK